MPQSVATSDIDIASDATDEDVQAIQTAAGETFSFRDKRDERTSGTYMAFVFCVYAFLTIIALVTVLNIVNSISMSVSAVCQSQRRSMNYSFIF